MTSLVRADGRLLRRTSPIDTGNFGGLFPPMWSDGERWGTDGAALASYADIYETQPVVGAAINKITRQASTLPLKVYRRNELNERERVFDHPLANLLSKPSPRRGSVHIKQSIFMSMLTHGNALVAKFREDPKGPPTALLPVMWSYIEAYAPQGGQVEVWATTQTGERRFLLAEDTVHVAWASPRGEIGTSPLKQLGTTIKIEDSARSFQSSYLANGGRPPSAITLAENITLTPEIRNEIRADLDAIYGGTANAGRPALLPSGAKWEGISHNAHEAELINQRYVDWEEIQMIFDLPGPLLADLRHGTYSNVTELNKQLYKSVLRPWLTLFEETIQAHLIDPEPDWQDVFVEFDLSEQLKGDPVQLAGAIESQIRTGVMTRNEGRKLLNLPRDPSPQADQLFYAANNEMPLGDPGTPPDDPPVLS